MPWHSSTSCYGCNRSALSSLCIVVVPSQESVLDSLDDGEDVLYVAQTGAGKSMCFMMPALLKRDKVVVVFSPLKSLMFDQAHVTLGSSRAYLGRISDASRAHLGRISGASWSHLPCPIR